MKNLRKGFALALALLVLVACGGKDSGSGDKKTYDVGVAIYRFEDNFMTLYREEIQKYFKELETSAAVKYNVDVQDGQMDQAKQIEQINNFINQEKDIIIANLVDPTAASTIIELTKKAGIPVVFINREPAPDDLTIWPGKTTYVGADATQSGLFQGEIIHELPNKGDINGDGVISYITLMGDPGNVDAQQRTEYSIKGYEALGGKVKALAEPYLGNWDSAKGQEFTANALEQFGSSLEVVFANNDGMALGAVVAIEAAGRKVGEDIFIVGVDAIPDAIKLLEEGTLTGTVLNDHFNQARTAVDVAVELLEGKDVKAYYWHDYVKVKEKSDAELKRTEARPETVEEVKERYKKR